MQIPADARLRCDYGVAAAIGSFLVWILLTIVTFGLAAFVAPYFIYSGVINRTEAVDAEGRRLGRLRVNVALAEIVGHAAIWLLLAIVTLGLAIFVYYYMVLRKVLNRTELQPQAPAPMQAAAPTPSGSAVSGTGAVVRR